MPIGGNTIYVPPHNEPHYYAGHYVEDGFAAPAVAGLPPSGILAVVPPGAYSPLSTLSFNVATVSTTTAVKKYLSLVAYNNSQIFAVHPTDGTILLSAGAYVGFTILGVTTWAAHATGYRQLLLEPFANNVALSTITLYNMPGNTAASPNVIPVALGLASVGADYYKISVTQTSGGNLDFSANLSIGLL